MHTHNKKTKLFKNISYLGSDYILGVYLQKYYIGMYFVWLGRWGVLLGNKVQNMKMGFNARGTWCRVIGP